MNDLGSVYMNDVDEFTLALALGAGTLVNAAVLCPSRCLVRSLSLSSLAVRRAGRF